MLVHEALTDDCSCSQVKELQAMKQRLLVWVSSLPRCTWLFPNISTVELYMSAAGGGRGTQRWLAQKDSGRDVSWLLTGVAAPLWTDWRNKASFPRKLFGDRSLFRLIRLKLTVQMRPDKQTSHQGFSRTAPLLANTYNCRNITQYHFPNKAEESSWKQKHPKITDNEAADDTIRSNNCL